MRGEPTQGQRAAAHAVRLQRAKKRFTQKDLAEAAGVSKRTVQHLESLDRPGATADYFPSLESLIGIEQALGWPPGHLLELSEKNTPTDAWKDVRRLLLQAVSLDDPAAMREVIADALVALGSRDPER